jgi:cell division transport system ATP-binding protein
MEGSGIIELRGATKVYPPRVMALADVSLDVEAGEFVFVIGASGAGKSSLLRLLYREERASAGRVVVNGQDLGRMRRQQIPFFRRQIGVVFQDFKLLPRRTIFDNVAFPLVCTEVSRRDIQRRVPQVLEMVGLLPKARAYPDELSGGEQQRAALARAVVGNPLLLLADEPTGNLDPETARGIMGLLVDVNRRGTTVLVATHSEAIVNSLRRRVVVLTGGRVVRDEEKGAYRLEAL